MYSTQFSFRLSYPDIEKKGGELTLKQQIFQNMYRVPCTHTHIHKKTLYTINTTLTTK